MKILVCVSEYFPHGSGIANVAYNIVESLKKQNIDCKICSPTGPDIKIGNESLIKYFGFLGILYFWLRVIYYVNRNKDEFDFFWYHNPLIPKKIKLKNNLVTIHTTYYGFMKNNFHPLYYYKLASIIEKKCFDKIKNILKFIAVSEQVKNELINIGINKEKILIIKNGVDTSIFKPSNDKETLRKKYNLPQKNLLILYLGRLTAVKQPIKLLKIFSLLEKRMNEITLLIVGDGELSKKVENYVYQNKIKNVIIFGKMDYKKDVPLLYSCCDCYISLSSYEGLPLTILEAISSGLPCIVSDIPNFSFIEQNRCGITIDYNNFEDSVNLIVNFIKNNTKKLSSNARKYAIENFDWKIIANEYVKQFNQLTKGKYCY
jgi:glycosyltransferase involved in cell wall biosynthesis